MRPIIPGTELIPIASLPALYNPRGLRLEKDSAFEEDSAHRPMWVIHLEGAMGASQTVLPFKLAASDESGGFRERESVQ